MINRITMETVACLRSKCHLKENLIPSWPWSFRYTSCISDFRCKSKYTNQIFFGHPDRHAWQYWRYLWFSARSVRWSDEFQKSAFRIKFRWCKWSIEPKRYVNEDKIKYKSFINQVNYTGSGVYFTCWKNCLTKFNFKNYKRKYNIFLVWEWEWGHYMKQFMVNFCQ
jgi:hypothetical protein